MYRAEYWKFSLITFYCNEINICTWKHQLFYKLFQQWIKTMSWMITETSSCGKQKKRWMEGQMNGWVEECWVNRYLSKDEECVRRKNGKRVAWLGGIIQGTGEKSFSFDFWTRKRTFIKGNKRKSCFVSFLINSKRLKWNINNTFLSQKIKHSLLLEKSKCFCVKQTGSKTLKCNCRTHSVISHFPVEVWLQTSNN